MMSEELGEQPWCSGNAFSLADVAVGVVLGYLDFRLPDIDWREQHRQPGAALRRADGAAVVRRNRARRY